MSAAMIINFQVEKNAPLITRQAVTLLMKGDNEANIIQVEMLDEGKPVILDGYGAVLYLRRMDGIIVRNPGTVSGNMVTVPLLESSYNMPGNYSAILRITGPQSEKRTILRMTGFIESDGEGTIIDPSGSIPSYDDLARIIQELDEALKEAEAATGKANAAAETATSAAGNATTAAGAANAAAASAEAAAISANTQAENAIQKAQQAEQAATTASEAASAANEKASIAELNASIAAESAESANQAASTANEAASAANAAAGNANTSASSADAATSNANASASSADAAAKRANDAAQAAENIAASIPQFFDENPSAPGEASAGSSEKVSRGDHVHPLPDLLPLSNGGTGVRDVPSLNQLIKSFNIVGTASDVNNARTLGLYVTTSATQNLPSGLSNGVLFVLSSGYTFNYTDGTIDQFFLPIAGGRIWRRSCYNDRAWGAWTVAALDSYPVGSIYMSYVSTSPASLFGGTWTMIQDRFLVGAGSSYAVGATGGSATVALSVDQMPAHTHIITMARLTGTAASWSTASPYGRYSGDEGGASFSIATGEKGSGSAHENRPPYYAVYMWRRTA